MRLRPQPLLYKEGSDSNDEANSYGWEDRSGTASILGVPDS